MHPIHKTHKTYVIHTYLRILFILIFFVIALFSFDFFMPSTGKPNLARLAVFIIYACAMFLIPSLILLIEGIYLHLKSQFTKRNINFILSGLMIILLTLFYFTIV